VLKARFGQIASRLLPDIARGSGLDANHISRDPEVVRAYRKDPLVHDRVSSRLYTEWTAARLEVMDRASSIEIPVLVICGSGDRLIHPSGSRDLAARLPRGLLKEYPERYHEPFNDYGSAEVFDDLATWLLRPTP
jgi:alpha-beta hydrolase superfamily lysophospholipase